MLNIKIVCIGQLSQIYWKLAQADYLTRIRKKANIETIVIAESKKKEISVKIKSESEKINKYLENNRDYQWLLLDLSGTLITSKNLAQLIIDNQNYQQSKIGFIIGGSNGVDNNLKTDKRWIKITFGHITLPHQLCYIVLIEQIYRALQIINQQPYHK